MKNDYKIISVRLESKDADALKDLANQVGHSVSEVLRTVVHIGLMLANDAMNDIDKKMGEIV